MVSDGLYLYVPMRLICGMYYAWLTAKKLESALCPTLLTEYGITVFCSAANTVVIVIELLAVAILIANICETYTVQKYCTTHTCLSHENSASKRVN